jgi:hypothetical protein
MWEEPCLAFLRLVVSTVHLGPAAAAAAPATADMAAASVLAAGGGSDDGSGKVLGSKAVLQRLAALLKGDAATKAVSWPLRCVRVHGRVAGRSTRPRSCHQWLLMLLLRL